MIALNRSLHALEQAHGVELRISYGKVAEYQRRGVVHFHALIRLDRVDPAVPDAVLAPPSDITAADLAALVADAVQRTVFRTPDYADTSHSWLIRWGRQLDIRPLGLPGDEITAEAVAGYLAKYATKATEPSGLPVTGRMTEAIAEQYSNPDAHLGRLIAFAYEFGTRPADWTTERDRAAAEGLAGNLGSPAPLNPHARIWRSLRHQITPLLHDPQDAAHRTVVPGAARNSRSGDAAISSTTTRTTTRRR